jgi:anti-anti-sigma regulatory factor
MLRIDIGGAIDGTRVLRLGGKVVGQWVSELRRCCDEIFRLPGEHLVLDLGDVTFIDASGIALLRELTERGVALTNCSPIAAEQLRASVETTWNRFRNA